MLLAEKIEKIDQKVDNHANELMKSVGYEIPRNMTFAQAQQLSKQMQQNGHKLDIKAEQQGTDYVVEINLTQTLVFKLE